MSGIESEGTPSTAIGCDFLADYRGEFWRATNDRGRIRPRFKITKLEPSDGFLPVHLHPRRWLDASSDCRGCIRSLLHAKYDY